jgi:glyoxylase-like metal-dependent hydrolase (beta-lactamase superfamily II)
MQIQIIKVGPLQTNCYLVTENGETLIIDPGAEIEEILKALGDQKVKAIVLTHGHYDHVTEAFKLKPKLKAPVMVHEKDETMMAYSTQVRADKLLKDGDQLLGFKVIHTPGHSSGSICLYSEKEKILFSGDTLFAGDYGRCDLPGSSQREMENSLKRLLALPPETKVYPGHGQPTTIGDEKNLIE